MKSKIIILGFYFWFVISGIFIVERVGIENWILNLIAYSFGLYYVHPFIIGKPMSVPYLDRELSPESKNLGLRLLLFLPALAISILVSIK
ncbi:hypothetical protein [Thalassotalea piscium]|uniref:Acyltransferase n=1 Tax=Thalassotalea piscium TaxID=1230533 RepID=A0A7X0TV53_9GAMM|nr:hypothetical protein [Thalassotalea piscium]MBB6545087.1 hypothetical protein [Thalassotalea piscium]